MALTAVSTDPKPVITTTGSVGSSSRISRSVSRPSTSPSRMSRRTRCGLPARTAASAAGAEMTTSQVWPRRSKKRPSARAWISSSSTIRMVATRLCSDAGGGVRRQADLDDGALPLVAADGDRPVVGGDDLLPEGGAEAGARLLRGGEQGEDRAEPLARDAPARVLHQDAGRGAAVGAGVARRGDADRAARGRRVDGVGEHDAHHLLHLVPVEGDGAQPGVEREVEREPLAGEGRAGERDAALDQRVHVLEGPLERDGAREAEQVAEPALQAIGGGHDVLETGPTRVIGREVEQLRLRGDPDAGQR